MLSADAGTVTIITLDHLPDPDAALQYELVKLLFWVREKIEDLRTILEEERERQALADAEEPDAF